ncbi:MAG TPA: hypothetical protein VGT03_09220 [Candidatus Acidoferrales bacterium]|nr:hypothetical protein [Candidatus Acidoferrales bacterium]
MRRIFGVLSLAALIAAAQVAVGQEASQTSQSQAQSQSQTQTSAKPAAAPSQAQKESVAEAARKAREAQKDVPKAPAVFTNDNISAAAASGTINVVGNASAPDAAAPAQAGQAAAPPAAGSDEAAWRQKFSDARAKLQQDQAELAIMQRELSQLQVQYYPDPSKALKQSVTNEDTYKKQQAIAAKQKQVQADQQALSDLEDAFRKAGGDSSWARE